MTQILSLAAAGGVVVASVVWAAAALRREARASDARLAVFAAWVPVGGPGRDE